jgi:hypothetical protein
MAGLLYRPDMDDVRERMTAFWNGGDIGRPAMHIRIPTDEILEDLPVMDMPAEITSPNYTVKSFEWRVNSGQRCGVGSRYFGEQVPYTSPDLAPNCLALFLGCKGVEGERTVWCEPFITNPDTDTPEFVFNDENFYWDFSRKLCLEYKRLGEGKFMQQFPDLIEGLDTLSALRGTQELLFDLIERPEWVHDCLTKISKVYFDYYDKYYEMIKDETGGSCFWAWAPGRMAKFQCDFSAMISPDMFGEFMVPVLNDLCNNTDYSMYHWDGPDAIPHLDHLISIENLDMIQWTPGAGANASCDPEWWPLFHRAFEGGKKVLIGCRTIEQLQALKTEFGSKCKGFLLEFGGATSEAEALDALKLMEC